MSHRDPGQPNVLLLAVELNLALQNALCRRTAQGLVRLIDRGQKLDVGPRVAISKTAPSVDGWPDPAASRVESNQPRRGAPWARTAHPGHLLDVAPNQTTRRLALLGILLPHQHTLHPAINLLTPLALKMDFLAGLDETANSFQAQLLCLVHADVQSPACLNLQAHLVLESKSSFRLTLYWKRVPVASVSVALL